MTFPISENKTNAFGLLTFFFIVVSNFMIAQNTTDWPDFFSPQSRLEFGNNLFEKKDYLRALDEFKYYLKNEDNDTVRYKFSECFFRIGRYDEAAENYKSLFFHSLLSDEARLGYYKSAFFKNDFLLFREEVSNGFYLPEKYQKEVIRLQLISHFFDNSILPDTNKFFPQFEDSSKTEIRRFYLMKKYPEKKNPTTASLLSAVIPGLGKIYTGEIGDGITAFIATGILTYLSVNNFKHDHNFRGWLFGGMAALSYAGNIYGSAASAHIYNAKVKYNFDNEVKFYFEERNYLLPEAKN